MSLIVANKTKDMIYLMGDTKLTYKIDKQRNPFVSGCLKIYRLSNKLAIAFAGIKDHFESDLASIIKCSSTEELIQLVIKSNQAGKDYDLIVADAEAMSLIFIKDGKANQSDAGFIGDYEAFNEYQKLYHEIEEHTHDLEVDRAVIQFLRIPEPVDDSNHYSKMYHSFKQIIQSASHTTVGGVLIPLCTDKGNFTYMNYADVVTDRLTQEDFTEEENIIKFGTTSGGGYSVEFSSDLSTDGEGNEIGFYFLQGGFGICFFENENKLKESRYIKSLTPANWLIETSKCYSNGIQSCFLTIDHCGIAAEEELKKQNWKEALDLYKIQFKPDEIIQKKQNIADRYFHGYCIALYNCGFHFESLKTLEQWIGKIEEPKRCESLLSDIQSRLGR